VFDYNPAFDADANKFRRKMENNPMNIRELVKQELVKLLVDPSFNEWVRKELAKVDVDFHSMTKQELVDHAQSVHGLELDPTDTKANLIAAVEDAQKSA